ncbi:MAG: trigger factor [Acetobacteraceae bacterium]
MQVTETLSDGLKRAYTIRVPAEDIETRRTARLTSLTKTVRLPGFRPGKVPMTVVRQRYGTAVSAEVLEESVSEATQRMMEERGLRPAMQPKVNVITEDPTSLANVGDLEFAVEMEVLPDITLPDFGTIALTRMTVEVGDEAIDKVVDEVAKGNRELVALTEEELAARESGPGAAQGDVLTVDFVGKIDGEPFEGGTGTDINVDLGSSTFIPGFEDQIQGMKPGEFRTITVTFPADYGSPNLAGKEATFDVTAKKISRGVVPTADDKLAEKIGYDSLGEMRDAIRQRQQREYDSLARLRLKRALLDALAEMVSFATPDGMVEREFSQIWERLQADREAGRLDEDDKNKDEETLRSDYRAIAERRVRLGLLLAEIGRVNSLTVSGEELTRAMRLEASRYPGQEEQMMELFRKYPALADNLRGPIFEEKVVDFVLELAQVTDQGVTPEELMKDPDAPAAQDSEAPATPSA